METLWFPLKFREQGPTKCRAGDKASALVSEAPNFEQLQLSFSVLCREVVCFLEGP